MATPSGKFKYLNAGVKVDSEYVAYGMCTRDTEEKKKHLPLFLTLRTDPASKAPWYAPYEDTATLLFTHQDFGCVCFSKR